MTWVLASPSVCSWDNAWRCSKPASVTDVLIEPQHPELGQLLEIHQSGVGDLGALQAQRLEVRQPLEVDQADVGDRQTIEVELP